MEYMSQSTVTMLGMQKEVMADFISRLGTRYLRKRYS